MQCLPLYCASSMSRSPNLFPLTNREQERYLQLPYNSTVLAPKIHEPNTQRTVLLLREQEQLFPRYKKTVCKIHTEEICALLAFCGDERRVCSIAHCVSLERSLRTTECYRKFIRVHGMQSRNARNTRNRLRINLIRPQ